MRPRFALAMLLLAGCSAERSAERLEPPLVGEGWWIAGHAELAPAEGGWIAAALPGDDPLFACVDAGARTDTSQWVGAVGWRGEERDFAPPSRRLGSIVCFEGPSWPKGATSAGRDLCLDLEDRFSRRTQALACRPVAAISDPALHSELFEELAALLRASAEGRAEEFFVRLDALQDRAVDGGLPLLAARLDLIAVYYLQRDGGESGEREARRRLDGSPEWIDDSAAYSTAAQLALERANSLVRNGRFREAREEAGRASWAFRRAGSEKTLSAVVVETKILADRGALREATLRLRAALDDCDLAPCHPVVVASARSSLTWWLAQQPEANVAELAEAERDLAAYVETESSGVDDLEAASAAINLALIQARQGRDPRPTLERVRRAVEAGAEGPAGSRPQELAELASIVEAEWLFDVDPSKAQRLAESLAESTADVEISGWAWSAVARSSRKLGDLEAASDAFERALGLHDGVTANSDRGRIPLGPGRIAEDFYRAARLAVERGRPADAWAHLARLDRRVGHAASRAECNPSTEEREAAEARRRELVSELVELERPSSKPRRRQREPLVRRVRSELQELARIEEGCLTEAVTSPVRFRAFAVEDEILLLERLSSGKVELANRAVFERGELRAALGRLDERIGDPEISDTAWISAAAPLAAGLVPPRPERLGSVTRWALHGAVQGVPIAALPLPDDGEAAVGHRWLADHTTVVVSAGAGSVRAARSEAPRDYLFIVDAEGNLPAAAALGEAVREIFPSSVVLAREQAELGRIGEELTDADWLHVGVHGEYDAAFPDLSRLRVAGGTLHAFDLTDGAGQLQGANLSACHGAEWETTAGSGRYGLAGALSRAGVPWVISSRTLLADRFAGRFNLELYGELARGQSVVEAYAASLRRARDEFPAALWSALVLLGAPAPAASTSDPERLAGAPRPEYVDEGGQTDLPPNPSWMGRHRAHPLEGVRA